MRRLSTVCSRSICICIEVGKRESIREVQRITTFCVHNLWEPLFFSFLFFSIDFSGCVLYFTFHHLNTKASNAKQLAFNLRLASLIHFSLANALIISQCSGSNWCCQSHIFIAQVMAKTLSSHLCYKKKKKIQNTNKPKPALHQRWLPNHLICTDPSWSMWTAVANSNLTKVVGLWNKYHS